MLDIAWEVHELDAAPPAAGDTTPAGDTTALVAAVVESEAPTPRRMRVATRAEGPVLPPRRHGLPAPGWRDGAFEGVVPAAGRLPLGFATAAPAGDPPVDLEDRGRAAADDGAQCREGGQRSDGPSPTDLLRQLGSPAPPRDAVPEPDATSTDAVNGDAEPDQRSP